MQRGTVLLVGTVLACAKAEPPPPPPPPAVDTVAATQGVADFWARWSRTLTDSTAEAYAALYADDARLDIQGVPAVVGKAALEAVVRPMFAGRDYTGAEASPHTTVVVSNDLVLQGGTFTETYVEGKKTSVEHGRFAASIARSPDGTWRFAYVMGIVDSTVARR
jgi:uncharacterized protein (TIGR02246 family)